MSSSSGITSPVKAAIQGVKGNGAQLVQIIKLPQALENSAKAVRLEGQIISQNKNNGSVRIETRQGPIDVKVASRNQPQIGQKIEIDIPAGRQPRQATIRTNATPQNVDPRHPPPQNAGQTMTVPAPNLTTRVVSQAPPQTPLQQQSTYNAPVGGEPPPQQNQTARNILQNTANLLQTIQQKTLQILTPNQQPATTVQQTTNKTVTPRPVTADGLVRLLATSPGQAQTIARDFISTLPQPISNIVSKISFRSSILAQNIINQTIQTPLLQTTTPQALTTALQNTTHPLLNNNYINQIQPISQTTLQQTTFLEPSFSNSSQKIIVPTTTQVPQSTPTATLAPITFNPASPNTPSTQPVSQIDIQIIKTTPPVPIMTQPILNKAPPPPIPATTSFTPPVISANTATTVSAVVTGFTAQGLPLVTIQGLGNTLRQNFILQQASPNLQLGSQLQITPQSTVPTAVQTSQALTNPLLRGFQWPALDQLYQTLQQLSPQAASSLTRVLPAGNNPAQTGTAAMVFIAAVKSGNFEMLLGEKKIDLLQRAGRGNILSSLTQDSTARAGGVETSPSGDWRAVPLPMFWENEIHKITLFTRREDQEANQDQNGASQTRFIFDLTLSRIGDVQIDGLIKDQRLNLVVRTNHAFSEPMQQTMRRAYTEALDQTELTGELNFQGSTQNWVHVLEKEEQLGVHV